MAQEIGRLGGVFFTVEAEDAAVDTHGQARGTLQFNLRLTPFGRLLIHPRVNPWNSALRVIRNCWPATSFPIWGRAKEDEATILKDQADFLKQQLEDIEALIHAMKDTHETDQK